MLGRGHYFFCWRGRWRRGCLSFVLKLGRGRRRGTERKKKKKQDIPGELYDT
jgi:hypothetical protein